MKSGTTDRIVAKDGTIVLTTSDTKALVGTWEGTFALDDGFQGETTMTIVESGPGTVMAFFEFRWNPEGYERYPLGDGLTRGYVTGDGALRLGGWDMWLTEENAMYLFTAYGNVGGKPGELRWSRVAEPRLAGT